MIATKPNITDVIFFIVIGFTSICLIASANYTINEWLDREFDKFHPKKKKRPSVNNKVKGEYVYIQYFLLSITGLFFAYNVNLPFFLISALLLVMGIIYNVRPMRSKEKVYLDVLSESINNPIRLALGWFIITETILPPSTLLIAYWMSGAFLMGIKRYAEYNSINDKTIAAQYRKSFLYYTSQSLLLSSFFYALCSVFFLGVFMYKYRLELIFSFPFVSLLFVWYFRFAFSPDSPMQHPEGLYTEKKFILYLVFLAILVFVLLIVDIPIVKIFSENPIVHSF